MSLVNKTNIQNIQFNTSITNFCEVNSSFDSAILRICYIGENRNGSYISKEAIEKAISSIYNCPIVCSYNRETDSFGGHDVEIVATQDGDLKLINATQPIGCIPESANVWFDTYEEEDGSVHEYLFAKVLLWKRQEAYQKLRKDGVAKHSMEIKVLQNHDEDGLYCIDDFEFTAFAIIGVEPCFEGSAIEMFSKNEFKQMLDEMMRDISSNYNTINTFFKVDNKESRDLTKGGSNMDDKLMLLAEYGYSVDDLSFSIEEASLDELKEKLVEMSKEDSEPDSSSNKFELTTNLIDLLARALSDAVYSTSWGAEKGRYIYVDSDVEKCLVYAWDITDWLLYGFSFTANGDAVDIDFENGRRMKYAIVEFDEGDQSSPFAQTYNEMQKEIEDCKEYVKKYEDAASQIEQLESKISELEEFKSNTENTEIRNKKKNILSQFSDLSSLEAFEVIQENIDDYDEETLTEKLYALRGRQHTIKFNLDKLNPKIYLNGDNQSFKHDDDPYGGIVEFYKDK